MIRVSSIGENLGDLQNILDYKQVARVQLADAKCGTAKQTHKVEPFVSSVVFVGQSNV